MGQRFFRVIFPRDWPGYGVMTFFWLIFDGVMTFFWKICDGVMTFSDEFAIRSWLYSENIRQGHDSTLKNMRPSHLYFLKSKNSSARTSILMNISLIPRNRGLSKTSLMSYENPESAKTLNKREIIRDFSRFFPFKNLQEKTYDILIYFPLHYSVLNFFFQILFSVFFVIASVILS